MKDFQLWNKLLFTSAMSIIILDAVFNVCDIFMSVTRDFNEDDAKVPIPKHVN